MKRRLVAAIVATLAVMAAACGGGDGRDAASSTPPSTTRAAEPTTVPTSQPAASAPRSGPDTTPPTAAPPSTTAPATTFPPLPERVVALSEELLLADLLALGVVPVASTSNSPDGFPGIDPGLTGGIEVMYSPEFNLEALAALRPGLIVVQQRYLDLGIVGLGDLEPIAPVAAIAGDDWRESLLSTGAAFGRKTLAEEVAAGVDAAIDDAAAVLDGRELSVVAIYSGGLVRTFADRGIALVDLLIDAGALLRPGLGTDGIDATGRITLSEERYDLLDAPTMLMLQSDLIDGESDARASVEASPLWQSLPAVANGDVVVLDRLGYPGATGAAAFMTDLAAAIDS